MSTFRLEILTPEHRFFDDEAEAVTVNCMDGEMTIMRNHEPLIAVLAIGQMRIKQKDGVWRNAFNSEGFIEVTQELVTIYVQACEWPEDIDVNRARAARQRAERRLLEQKSRLDYQHAQISLARALARLRTSGRNPYEKG
jgi:F-type H+-transporting ATPase subunit epsilon